MPEPLTPDDELGNLAYLARSPAHILVIRYLVDHPDAFLGDIREASKLPTSNLQRYLRELEQHGIISGDIPVLPRRRGRSIRYRTNVDVVEKMLARLRDELLG